MQLSHEERLDKRFGELVERTTDLARTIAREQGTRFEEPELRELERMLFEDRVHIVDALKARDRKIEKVPRDYATEGKGWVNQQASVETLSLELAVKAYLLLLARKRSARAA